MATPHIAAEKGDFAPTVLMPGDPLRAQVIAERYLKDARLVNNVRGVQGYTGTYRGKAVSVMASGMGMPSIGIYSYELFNFFGVQSIIRVGSAGAISPGLRVRDIVLAMGACTDSRYGAQFSLPGTFAPIADWGCWKKPCARRRRGRRLSGSETCCPAICFTMIPAPRLPGEKWACSRWKWKRPRSI